MGRGANAGIHADCLRDQPLQAYRSSCPGCDSRSPLCDCDRNRCQHGHGNAERSDLNKLRALAPCGTRHCAALPWVRMRTRARARAQNASRRGFRSGRRRGGLAHGQWVERKWGASAPKRESAWRLSLERPPPVRRPAPAVAAPWERPVWGSAGCRLCTHSLRRGAEPVRWSIPWPFRLGSSNRGYGRTSSHKRSTTRALPARQRLRSRVR